MVSSKVLFAALVAVICAAAVVSAADIPDESWGYVPVRPNANMFW